MNVVVAYIVDVIVVIATIVVVIDVPAIILQKKICPSLQKLFLPTILTFKLN